MVAPPENLGEYAVWGIAIWTVVNVGGVLIFHMLQPDARRKMVLQSEMDLVFDEALKKLSTRRVAIGGELSDRLADGMLAQLVAGLSLEGNRPALERALPAAEAKPLPVSENHRGDDFLA